MNEITLDHDLLHEIAARLDLREPNREALESFVIELSQHYDVLGKQPPLEAVVDVATGVGKTYIMAGAMEYLSLTRGIRNFAVIAPGRTILRKTADNFTPGTSKSLLDGMLIRPVVITSDNFASPHIRAIMDDPQQIKLYIFTVQALTKPETQAGRRTHDFRESLGKAFYQHLVGLSDLVVFADEHHTYYGAAFSRTIRELRPYTLIGLTATPHKKTPVDQIIYRYPLAAGIADRLVKTPVIVGRQDDRTDAVTKLLDGVRLLEAKRVAAERYCARTGADPVNPVMLVIAKTIDDAQECRRILEDPAFAGGAYIGRVLEIHSDSPDEALEQLEGVEQPISPHRVIVSVGMLKEGWDVKNVYVIVSLRASVSEILTEQTLGRGLRLPFGAYTGIEMLDTLEVLAHERYEELLRRANVLNEAFIDHRTRAALRLNAEGQQVATRTNVTVTNSVTAAPTGAAGAASGQPVVSSTEQRFEQAEATLGLVTELPPRDDKPPLRIPRLVMRIQPVPFSLADIVDYRPFRELGERIAADPSGQLRRTTVSAMIVTSSNGLRQTALITSTGVDVVYSPASNHSLSESIDLIRHQVLQAPVVPARKAERQAVEPIIQEFLRGLGPNAETILSQYQDRAVAELIQLITAEHRRYATKPGFEELVEITTFAPTRTARPATSLDRFGPFSKSVGYEGWRRSMYAQAWFDSATERTVANMIDNASEVAYWVRLERGDLPILWHGAGNWYHPDFVVVENDATHWIVEVKADNEMKSIDVQEKHEAAKRWANHVSAHDEVGLRWRYLLVSESQIETVKGSWFALKQMGS